MRMKAYMNRITLLIILFISLKSFGQDTTGIKKQNILTKPAGIVSFSDKYKIGFYLGFGYSNFSLTTNNINQGAYKDSLNSISKNNQFSTIDFGIYLENKITNQLAIRTKLTMVGDALNLTYKRRTENENLDVFNMSVAIPIHLIAQTKGENSRLYFACGPSIMFGLGADEKTKYKLNPKQFDVALEAGIGYYIRFKKLFVSPEIKFSQGLVNINGLNQTIYAQTISNLYRQNIVFALTFSGH